MKNEYRPCPATPAPGEAVRGGYLAKMCASREMGWPKGRTMFLEKEAKFLGDDILPTLGDAFGDGEVVDGFLEVAGDELLECRVVLWLKVEQIV